MSPQEAMAELRRYKGTRFDPDVVEAICGEIEAGRVPPPVERVELELPSLVQPSLS
jgi:HD-GYP domain-containing protein (c-di-GMP phosphodiesterase class II)